MRNKIVQITAKTAAAFVENFASHGMAQIEAVESRNGGTGLNIVLEQTSGTRVQFEFEGVSNVQNTSPLRVLGLAIGFNEEHLWVRFDCVPSDLKLDVDAKSLRCCIETRC